MCPSDQTYGMEPFQPHGQEAIAGVLKYDLNVLNTCELAVMQDSSVVYKLAAIGHESLKSSNLQKAKGFYCKFLHYHTKLPQIAPNDSILSNTEILKSMVALAYIYAKFSRWEEVSLLLKDINMKAPAPYNSQMAIVPSAQNLQVSRVPRASIQIPHEYSMFTRDLQVLQSMANGTIAAAIRIAAESYGLKKSQYGESAPFTLWSLHVVYDLLVKNGNLEEAEVYRSFFPSSRKGNLRSPDHLEQYKLFVVGMIENANLTTFSALTPKYHSRQVAKVPTRTDVRVQTLAHALGILPKRSKMLLGSQV